MKCISDFKILTLRNAFVIILNNTIKRKIKKDQKVQ